MSRARSRSRRKRSVHRVESSMCGELSVSVLARRVARSSAGTVKSRALFFSESELQLGKNAGSRFISRKFHTHRAFVRFLARPRERFPAIALSLLEHKLIPSKLYAKNYLGARTPPHTLIRVLSQTDLPSPLFGTLDTIAFPRCTTSSFPPLRFMNSCARARSRHGKCGKEFIGGLTDATWKDPISLNRQEPLQVALWIFQRVQALARDNTRDRRSRTLIFFRTQVSDVHSRDPSRLRVQTESLPRLRKPTSIRRTRRVASRRVTCRLRYTVVATNASPLCTMATSPCEDGIRLAIGVSEHGWGE